MQRGSGGVRFICANQLLPPSQIWATLLTSSSWLPRMEFQTNIGSLGPSTGLKPSVTNTCMLRLFNGHKEVQRHVSMAPPYSNGSRDCGGIATCAVTTCKHLRPTITQSLVDEQPTWKPTLTPPQMSKCELTA